MLLSDYISIDYSATPIRIPYIRSIIITSYHQCLFFLLFSPRTPHGRPYSSSSADLSSVKLLWPIIPHHQIRVHFVIILYIYLLFRHLPSGYPISDQLSSPPIIIWHNSHHHTIFQFISRPHFRPYRSSPHITPISGLHQSVSADHQSILPDPIIQFTRSSISSPDLISYFQHIIFWVKVGI